MLVFKNFDEKDIFLEIANGLKKIYINHGPLTFKEI